MAEVGQIYESTTYCNQGLQTSVNVFHWIVNSKIGTGATDDQIVTQMDALFGPVMKPVINAVATYNGCGVRRLTPPPLGAIFYKNILAGAGTGGTTPLPRQVTGVITWKTALAGRRYRGRWYIPFPAISQTGAGAETNPIPGYLTLLNAIIAAVLPGVTCGVGGNTNKLDPIVFSRKFNLSTPLLSGVASKLWGTQRKRGSYGRPNPSPV